MNIRVSLLTALGLFATAIAAQAFEITGTNGTKLEATEFATFNRPWAMTFLPDGAMLVNEKGGSMVHIGTDGVAVRVANIPDVESGGQAGFGDVIPHPDFENNNIIYYSYVEPGRRYGSVVARATLNREGTAALTNIERLW